MLDMQVQQEVVTTVARRYARLCWWAELEELKQVGYLAIAEASRTYIPGVGVPADKYARKACIFAMARYLWEASSPVSGGKHRPKKSKRGLRRTEVTTTGVDGLGDDVATAMLLVDHDQPTAEVLVDDVTWHRRVRARLRELAASSGLDDVLPVLLEETTPAALAAGAGVPVARYHSRSQHLRSWVMADEGLALLLRDRKA